MSSRRSCLWQPWLNADGFRAARKPGGTWLSCARSPPLVQAKPGRIFGKLVAKLIEVERSAPVHSSSARFVRATRPLPLNQFDRLPDDPLTAIRHFLPRPGNRTRDAATPSVAPRTDREV